MTMIDDVAIYIKLLKTKPFAMESQQKIYQQPPIVILCYLHIEALINRANANALETCVG